MGFEEGKAEGVAEGAALVGQLSPLRSAHHLKLWLLHDLLESGASAYQTIVWVDDDVVAEEDTTVAILADYLRRSFRGMVVEESALESILIESMECVIEDSGLIIF